MAIKKVFISYSWDSEEHKEWVMSLANTLRSVYGIEATVDDFLLVSNLNKMMVQEISNNDKVIIIVTAKYTEKANTLTGGVGYETELLLNYVQTNPNKLIVLLKEQCEKPFYLSGYIHIDFSKDKATSIALEQLVLKIKDQPNYKAEEVNTTNPKEVNPKRVELLSELDESEDLVADIERMLSITGYGFNAKGKIDCATWIKDYGYEIVLESTRIALQQYLVCDDTGAFTEESINLVFSRLGGICNNKFQEKTKPYVAGTKKVLNYCKKKFNLTWSNVKSIEEYIGKLLYYYYKNGLYEEKLEDYLQLSRTAYNKNYLISELEAEIESLGI